MFRLIATARQHPELAARLLRELPEELQGELVAQLALPNAARPKPGLRKCEPKAKGTAPNNGLSAQLASFARTVSRVR